MYVYNKFVYVESSMSITCKCILQCMIKTLLVNQIQKKNWRGTFLMDWSQQLFDAGVMKIHNVCKKINCGLRFPYITLNKLWTCHLCQKLADMLQRGNTFDSQTGVLRKCSQTNNTNY